MIHSRLITDSGSMLGVITTGDAGWLFTAVDPRLEDLHGSTFSTPAEADRVVRLVLDRGRGRAGRRA